jgi:hypothetical protein
MLMTTPLVETERFKEGLARFDADLMAARALLEAQIARVWQNPERAAGKDITPKRPSPAKAGRTGHRCDRALG